MITKWVGMMTVLYCKFGILTRSSSNISHEEINISKVNVMCTERNVGHSYVIKSWYILEQ